MVIGAVVGVGLDRRVGGRWLVDMMTWSCFRCFTLRYSFVIFICCSPFTSLFFSVKVAILSSGRFSPTTVLLISATRDARFGRGACNGRLGCRLYARHDESKTRFGYYMLCSGGFPDWDHVEDWGS